MNSEENSWKEVQYPEKTEGPIYAYRRGYKVMHARRHETAKQFAVFQTYLRMPGTRNLAELSRLTGHSVPTLSDWSKKWQWEKRAAAWETDQIAITYREVDKLKREAHRQAIIDFRNSSERQARMMSRVSEDLVRLLGKRIADAEEKGEDIPMHMVGGLLRAAASLQEQSVQAWGSALGIDQLLDVVETEIEKVRVEELESGGDPYDFEIEE